MHWQPGAGGGVGVVQQRPLHQVDYFDQSGQSFLIICFPELTKRMGGEMSLVRIFKQLNLTILSIGVESITRTRDIIEQDLESEVNKNYSDLIGYVSKEKKLKQLQDEVNSGFVRGNSKRSSKISATG